MNGQSEMLERLVKAIMDKTGLSREDVLKEIELKRKEMNNLVSMVGAAQIVAKKHGISLFKEVAGSSSPLMKSTISETSAASSSSKPRIPRLKIKNLLNLEPGSVNISIDGVVLRVYNPVSFSRDGDINYVARVLLGDNTGYITVVLWSNWAKKVLRQEITFGSFLRIRGGVTRRGRSNSVELHVQERSEIQINPEGLKKEDFPDPWKYVLSPSRISDWVDDALLVGTVVYTDRTTSSFSRSDGTTGTYASVWIADTEQAMRVVFWGDQAAKALELKVGEKILLQGVRIKRGFKSSLFEASVSNRSYVINLGKEEVPAKFKDFSPPDAQEGVVTSGTAKSEIDVNEMPFFKIKDVEPQKWCSLAVRLGVKGELLTKFKKDGVTPLKLLKGVFYDETAAISFVAWEKAADIMNKFKEGDPLVVKGVIAKEGRYGGLEVQLNEYSVVETKKSLRIPKHPPYIKITDLNGQKQLISVQGIVRSVYETRNVTFNDGREAKVQNFLLQDETGITRVALWNEAIEQYSPLIQVGKAIALWFTNVITSTNERYPYELRLSAFSKIIELEELSSSLQAIIEQLQEQQRSEGIVTEGPVKTDFASLSKIEEGRAEISGRILSFYRKTPFYWSCSQCWRAVKPTLTNNGDSIPSELNEEKFGECSEHGRVPLVRRLVLTAVFDDGLATVPITFFGKNVSDLLGIDTHAFLEMYDSMDSLNQFFDEIERSVQGKYYCIKASIKQRKNELLPDEEPVLDIRANQVTSATSQREAEFLIKQIRSILEEI